MSKQTNVLEFPVQGFSCTQDFYGSESEESLSSTLENPACKKIQTPFSPTITDELLADLVNLTKMQLRAKYKREASSHKNRKSVCKKNGGKFAEEYEDFRSFLGLVGVCPGPGKWSLDRIDNSNLDYGPGLVRWANAKTQNNNKGDTILLTHNGITNPLTWWAEETYQIPDTLRKRHQRGWPDHQVIYGKPSTVSTGSSGYAPSLWKRLIPDREPESYKKIEAEYKRSRGRKDSRMRWLAAVAFQHIESLKEILIDQDYEGTTDPELDFQYGCWNEINNNINRELALTNAGDISNYFDRHKRRAVGRITWRH